jgi:hypothetical protein
MQDETPDDVPTGLPDEETEAPPLGVQDPQPEGEGDPARGEDAMPGIPTEGEPPDAG